MSWRADWGGTLIGRAESRDAAQALVTAEQFHALVMNEQTGERWIFKGKEGWVETVAGRLIEPKPARPPDPDALAPSGHFWWQDHD